MESTVERVKRWFGFYAIGIIGMAMASLGSGCGGVSENEVVVREMVAGGKSSYRAYCVGCHGPEGRGDGPAADLLTVPAADLTQIAARHGEFPEAAIFQRIDGYSTAPDSTIQMMPSWGNIWRGMNTEVDTPQDVRNRIDQIVAFLRSIQETPSVN